MATDIEYAIKRMRNIVIKSRAKMKNNMALALMELPPANQIRRLKKVANEMDKTHKAVMRLAMARESAGERPKNKGKSKKSISPQEIEKRWKSVDLSLFWKEVAEGVSKEADEYRCARAKSRGANQVFV